MSIAKFDRYSGLKNMTLYFENVTNCVFNVLKRSLWEMRFLLYYVSMLFRLSEMLKLLLAVFTILQISDNY